MATILSALLIAATTSFLTVQLALWRFRSEKWWERKVDLYSRLIEAVYAMHVYNSEWLAHFQPEEDVSLDEKEKRRKRVADLWDKHREAQSEIDKLLVIGTFIACEKVLNDLRELKGQNAQVMKRVITEDQGTDVFDAAEEAAAIAASFVTRIRDDAKEDLGVMNLGSRLTVLRDRSFQFLLRPFHR